MINTIKNASDIWNTSASAAAAPATAAAAVVGRLAEVMRVME